MRFQGNRLYYYKKNIILVSFMQKIGFIFDFLQIKRQTR